MSQYIDELAGVVALPTYMDCSAVDLARRIRVCIEYEQSKLAPDNALIATLCDAARFGWEFLDYREKGR